MTFRSPTLLKAARDQPCIRCGIQDGTVVAAHYTGARRLNYGGGLGIKVADCLCAHLCSGCHAYMDTLSRNKAAAFDHSEQFLHLIALTLIRLFEQEVVK
jgi:hypothetical protein